MMSARPPVQRKGMRSHLAVAKSAVGPGLLDCGGEELERPSHHRVVSCGLMTGRNDLITECVGINCLTKRVDDKVNDDGRGVSRHWMSIADYN